MRTNNRKFISIYFEDGHKSGRKKRDTTISFNEDSSLYKQCQNLGSKQIKELLGISSLAELKQKSRKDGRSISNYVKHELKNKLKKGQQKKRVLLVEPSCRTKYPPLGLMKIATYHKLKGDEVVFVKGCDKNIRNSWWDRIYIATLFTWTWKETVKTINFYNESLFKIPGKIFVGGILANLMPQELFNATGIQPVEGLLDDPKKLGQDDDIIIDALPPDYTVLNQVEKDNFQYNLTDAYLGYASRGCVRNCEYCAVKILEPKFTSYIDIKKTIEQTDEQSGKKKDLLLMDNNVLASPRFDDIIDDIKSAGFVKGATLEGKKRIVDFNQGLDARLLTEKKMKRLSEIPLEPMRIAFDDICYEKVYVKAVRLANKHGQKNMSNYVLYNFKNDTPEDFYERLKINIDLNEEFKKNPDKPTVIYSFPMRYIPLMAKDRNIDTGNTNWNKRYLRSIKIILNVTKGPVMPGADFFYQAFGQNAEDFKAVLLMPEEFIRNRVVPGWREIKSYEKRLMPYVRDWRETYSALSEEQRAEVINVLGQNNIGAIREAKSKTKNKKVNKLFTYHLEGENVVNNCKEKYSSREAVSVR